LSAARAFPHEAAVFAYDAAAAGTTAILDANPFERRFRDTMSASQHLRALAPHLEMVGCHLLRTENKVQRL
jgi:hypothetical protein